MAVLLGKLAVEEDVAPGFVGQLLQAVPAAAPATGASGMQTNGIAQPASQRDLHDLLTRRELEVMKLLAQRLTAQEIAEQLVISDKTVRRHTATIYHKLGINKRKDLVAIGRSSGLLS
jgi:DNA-binding NarL/FixJ family response regulator